MLIDVTRLVWRRWAGRHLTGIDRVCLAYLRHFAGDAQAVVQHSRYRRILDKQSSAALFSLLQEPPARFRRELLAGILRFGGRSRCNGNGRLYLNIGHTGLDDPRLGNWIGEAGVRPIYFVHDLIPITHPEFCRAGERERHRSRMRTALATAAGLIGNSQATLDDLAIFGRREDLAEPPALVAWLGSTAFPPPLGVEASAQRPTFIVVGTIEARKNHLMLLHVWTRLAETFGQRTPRLLIIGQRGWECEQVIDMLERSERLRGSVVEVGECGDQALANHFASARALLFPSWTEGFGLPLIEALGAGTPVIASDLPVFHEIGQSVPDFLDPLDGPAWERAIISYAETDSPARRDQLRRLAAFKAPTWKSHFAAVEVWLAHL